TRRYQEDTLVLETDFEAGSSAVRIIDFMPMREGEHSYLVRLVVGLRGEVPMRMDIAPRFSYGTLSPWMRLREDGFAGNVGPDLIVLRTPVTISHEERHVRARFTVKEGERIPFVLSYGSSWKPEPPPIDPEQALRNTQRYWRDWVERFDKPTDWPEAVKRSLITLKALIYRPSGGLIAAPTTSLPEKPGGQLNWDYRYSWIRDATFTLDALLNAGFHEEARAWRDWMLCAIAGQPDEMRIMYKVDGARHIPEWDVPWLDGYGWARPVRVGNAASTQHQADIYGELIDAMHLAARAGVERTERCIEVETKIVEHIEKTWREPGAGLWESRGEPRHYVYSRAMAWVGVDRFLKSKECREHAGPERVKRWEKLRGQIHSEVCNEGYHSGLGRFVEYYGGQTIDACLLLLPLVNFLPIDDPRIAATIKAVEEELMEGGLVRRKKPKSENPQGAFIVCTLWLADCQSMQGRDAEARKTLERVLEIRNDLGLLSEEYNVRGRHLSGNFPQALSHLGLVTTSLGLCGPVLQRGGG
ncbi:MAG TPA: glycoside hydrolase family 15 protein, partial [Acetobacteraceae bacterium]|nr:glycoside hydrolase family 15 protein [Acetobacteraceae bacterium]